MKIVLDTNVFVSGVFFSGPPNEILRAWRDRLVTLVVSAEILAEYRRVGQLLAGQYRGVDLEPFLALLAVHAQIVDAPPLPEAVCQDPDDDKFLACALTSATRTIVSGDRALLRLTGHRGIQVLTPRQFVDAHLPERTPGS